MSNEIKIFVNQKVFSKLLQRNDKICFRNLRLVYYKSRHSFECHVHRKLSVFLSSKVEKNDFRNFNLHSSV